MTKIKYHFHQYIVFNTFMHKKRIETEFTKMLTEAVSREWSLGWGWRRGKLHFHLYSNNHETTPVLNLPLGLHASFASFYFSVNWKKLWEHMMPSVLTSYPTPLLFLGFPDWALWNWTRYWSCRRHSHAKSQPIVLRKEKGTQLTFLGGSSCSRCPEGFSTWLAAASTSSFLFLFYCRGWCGSDQWVN